MAEEFPSDQRWSVTLWSADWVVLYEWLMSVDMSTLPVGHKAEKQALTDLLSNMEFQIDVGVTQDQIDAAREAVARDMGWE